DTWRVPPSDDAPMGRQLALSEALLAGLADHPQPALRWYVTSREALVLGNGQKPYAVVDFAAAHARDVSVFHRTSGGTAVLVDANALSMEVALPAGHPLASSDIVRAYRWLGEVWAEALRSLGVSRARAIPTEEVRALPPLAKDDPVRLACYGTLSPWEVVVGERKLVGLCQLRRRAGVLYQAGVHLRWEPERLVGLLALPEETRADLARRLRTTTLGLDEAAGRAVTPAEVIAAVEASVTARHGVTLAPGDWRADELGRAEEIERERFTPIP
ncbi:MAG: lipoate--protein ligase family protein, partial [Ktedonobacterales bacterium]